MGEIRSTLDIIMEKAKGMEVTDEDKTAFMRHEVQGKIRGLVQKVLDGFIDVNGLQSEMKTFGPDRYETAVAALGRECLERMVLDGDNSELLDILSRVARVATKPVEEVLLRYEEMLAAKRSQCQERLVEQLKRKGISGSAVVPNLKADRKWMDFSADERGRFHQALTGLYGIS